MLGHVWMLYLRAARIRNPNVCKLASTISLPRSQANSVVIALSILDRLITTRWKILPKEQCQGIRNYIVSVMITTSSDDTIMNRERTYLNKLNLTLVAVRSRSIHL